MQTKNQVWGRMALAFSSRCFSARHHWLSKDNCEFRCEQYPDGLRLAAREAQDFLTINGIQTQSSSRVDLSAPVRELTDMKIDVLCLQPQSQHMAEIVTAFDLARREKCAAKIDDARLPSFAQRSNGYWLARPGMCRACCDRGRFL